MSGSTFEKMSVLFLCNGFQSEKANREGLTFSNVPFQIWFGVQHLLKEYSYMDDARGLWYHDDF